MKKLFNLGIVLLSVLAFGLTACGGGSDAASASQSGSGAAEQEAANVPSGDPAKGKELFAGTCAACHGPEGGGVPGLGKDMTTSEFIAERNDAELVEFIKQGRDPSHPLNTTGVAMPPKGGNPALSEDDLFDIAAYVRTLQEN